MLGRTLRVRRYVNDELVDTRQFHRGDDALDLDGADVMGALDAEWCALQVERGNRYRIVIDDPAGDVGTVVVLEGDPRGYPPHIGTIEP